MATRAAVGFSEKTNSREAGIEAARAAMQRLETVGCDLVLLFATSKHDPSLLRDGIRSVVGEHARFFGGSAIGVITNERLGYEGYQVGVGLITSDAMKFDLFLEGGLAGNEYGVGRNLGRRIRAGGSVENLLLLYDIVQKGVPGGGFSLNMATPLLQGLGEEFETWPRTAGGGLVGDMQWNRTFQVFDDRIEQQSAMALVLSGDARLDATILHGCNPASAYYTITKADGNVVLELDGKPAVDVISGLVGADSEKTWMDYPLYITLGVNNGDPFGDYNDDDYAVRMCMDIDRERGGLAMFGDDLTAGKQVQLMRRSIDFDYITARTRALLERIADREPVMALYIDCAGRTSANCATEHEEAEEVQKAIGADIPLLGWYVGCEIAKAGPAMQSHNWTGVLSIVSVAR